MVDLGLFWAKISDFLTSLGPSEGSKRLNRAAATPIGQQNQPGYLKLLGLDENIGKIPILILVKKKTLNILDAYFVALCRSPWAPLTPKSPRKARKAADMGVGGVKSHIFRFTMHGQRRPFSLAIDRIRTTRIGPWP